MKRLSLCLCASVVILLCSCAAMKTPTAGSVNQNITTAIADAGAAAIAAENEYTSGQIPQTATNRTLINDLGGAYNEARQAFGVLLDSEAAYNAAQVAQVAQCNPPSNGSTPAAAGALPPNAACQQATQGAAAQQAKVTAAAQALNAAVSTMVTKTSAVKAITK